MEQIDGSPDKQSKRSYWHFLILGLGIDLFVFAFCMVFVLAVVLTLAILCTDLEGQFSL